MPNNKRLPYQSVKSRHRMFPIKRHFSQKFRNILRKTPVLESVFHKVAEFTK